MYLQRSRYARDDPPLKFEPVFQLQLECLAPYVDVAVHLLQDQDQTDAVARLLCQDIDLVGCADIRWLIGGYELRRLIGHVPLAEPYETGDQMLAKTLDEMRFFSSEPPDIDDANREHKLAARPHGRCGA